MIPPILVAGSGFLQWLFCNIRKLMGAIVMEASELVGQRGIQVNLKKTGILKHSTCCTLKHDIYVGQL